MTLIPGRTCPPSYRYPPRAFERSPDLVADTILVAGGVYGNEQALDELVALQRSEPQATLVFNGDFNWFNVDAASFRRINRRVLEHTAIRGNVETELAAAHDGAGCGCGYPEWVGDAEVARSNAIMARLRQTASAAPDLQHRLGALPPLLLAEVGGLRVAIVHGDLQSLAGWELSQERLGDAAGQARIAEQMERWRLRVLASSHTCLPVAVAYDGAQGASAVINNGAAGMPNFAQTGFGVVSRISVRPAQRAVPLYTVRVGAVFVEALPLHYDHDRFVRAFNSNWPAGSAAQLSYARRIEHGPAYGIDQALRQARIETVAPGQAL